MVHPDYQSTPKLIPAMAGLVASGIYPCVLASRVLGGGAREGGMPWWRYVANRGLTLAGNILLGTKLSEFHTGYRAFSREILESLPLEANSDDFVFDNEILAEVLWRGGRIGEVSWPDALRPGRVVDQLPPQRPVRLGVPRDGDRLPARPLGARAIAPVSQGYRLPARDA